MNPFAKKRVVVVTGSRMWPERLSSIVVNQVKVAQVSPRSTEIYVGDCPTGVDKYTRENFACRVFLADWDSYGSAAGPRRNGEMLRHALDRSRSVYLIAFWDAKRNRSGTLDCIAQATELGIPASVIPMFGHG